MFVSIGLILCRSERAETPYPVTGRPLPRQQPEHRVVQADLTSWAARLRKSVHEQASAVFDNFYHVVIFFFMIIVVVVLC